MIKKQTTKGAVSRVHHKKSPADEERQTTIFFPLINHPPQHILIFLSFSQSCSSLKFANLFRNIQSIFSFTQWLHFRRNFTIFCKRSPWRQNTPCSPSCHNSGRAKGAKCGCSFWCGVEICPGHFENSIKICLAPQLRESKRSLISSEASNYWHFY